MIWNTNLSPEIPLIDQLKAAQRMKTSNRKNNRGRTRAVEFQQKATAIDRYNNNNIL
jgi:hypothetical protein